MYYCDSTHSNGKEKIVDITEILPRYMVGLNQFEYSGNEYSLEDAAPEYAISLSQVNFENIDLGGEIGKGAYSTVHQGIWNETTVAVKRILQVRIFKNII